MLARSSSGAEDNHQEKGSEKGACRAKKSPIVTVARAVLLFAAALALFECDSATSLSCEEGGEPRNRETSSSRFVTYLDESWGC